MNPTVSVIIPTYNRAEMLAHAVKSVLQQTYSNYEIIITNNCSSDNTEQVALQFKKDNPKVIRYFRNNTNLGMVGNWNKGLSYARGKYIAILNDDDLWKKDFLKQTCRILDGHPNVGLVHTKLTMFTSRLNATILLNDHSVYSKSCEVPGIRCIQQFLESTWQVSQPSASMFRSKCIKDLGVIDEIGLDTEYWVRICSRYDFYYLNEGLSLMREHVDRYTIQNTDPYHEYSTMLSILKMISKYTVPSSNRKDVKKSLKRAYFNYRLSIISRIVAYKEKYRLNRDLFNMMILYSKCAPLLLFLPDIILFNNKRLRFFYRPELAIK